MSAAAAPAAEADDGPAQPASEKEPEMPGPRDESEEEEEEEEDDEEEEKGGQGRASLTGGIFTSKVFFLPLPWEAVLWVFGARRQQGGVVGSGE